MTERVDPIKVGMVHHADALATHEEDLLAGRVPPGWKPHQPGELEAIKKLKKDHPDEPISVTRRDPGESGPLLLHVGDESFIVAGGKLRKER